MPPAQHPILDPDPGKPTPAESSQWSLWLVIILGVLKILLCVQRWEARRELARRKCGGKGDGEKMKVENRCCECGEAGGSNEKEGDIILPKHKKNIKGKNRQNTTSTIHSTISASMTILRPRRNLPNSQRQHNLIHRRHRPKNPTLGLNTRNRTIMKMLLARRRSIFHQQTIESIIIRLPHRAMHTNIRRNSTQHQILDSLNIEHQLKLGMLKSTSTRFVDNVFAVDGVQFWYDIVTWFSADEQATEGADVADAET